MTQEERRIKILEKRLRLLAEYLDRFDDSDNAPSFAQFIKSKGVTREMFIKDLPPGYENVPASGYDNILEYSLILMELLNGVNNLAEMEQIHADGNNLREGLTEYHGQYLRDDCRCGCGEGDDKDSASADGGDSFNAAGCGPPPLPPLFPNPSKQNNALQKWQRKQWDNYKSKHEKYRRCINAVKDQYTLQDRAERALHLSNPAEAIGRVAFLKVVAGNIFGLAQTFEKMRKSPNQSHMDRLKKFWYRWGGDLKKLDSNISQGHKKKPIFKPKGWTPKGGNADGEIYSADGVWYNSGAAEAAGIIAAATAFISAVVPIVKSFKKDNGIPDSEIPDDPLNPPPGPPDGDPDLGGLGDGEGLSTGAWIGISVGAALVLGLIGYVAFKK